MNKDQTGIVYQIATDLLDNDALDLNNFGCDADSLLIFVQEIILSDLKDYLIISGVLLWGVKTTPHQNTAAIPRPEIKSLLQLVLTIK